MSNLQDKVVLFDPPLGSTTAIAIDRNQLELGDPEATQTQADNSVDSSHDSTLNLYFYAHLEGIQDLDQATERLQVWTNLPTNARNPTDHSILQDEPESSETTAWKAWDLNQTLSSSSTRSNLDLEGRVTLFSRLPISSKFLTKSKANHPSLPHTITFEYTYRIFHQDGNITWLGQNNNNGRLEMHLPSDGYDSLSVGNLGRTEITKEMKLNRFRKSIGLIEDNEVQILSFDVEEEREISVVGIQSLSQVGVEVKKDICKFENGEAIQGLVIERTKLTWHTSRSFCSIQEISDHFESSLLVLKLPLGSDYQVAVLLPLQTSTSSTTLSRSGSDCIAARVAISEEGSGAHPSVVISMGKENEVNELVKACIKTAAQSLQLAPKAQLSISSPSGPLHPSNGLGLCTWEALGPGSPPLLSRVLSILSSLESRFGAGSVTALLIDDGWASVDRTSSENSRGSLLDWELDESLLDVEIPSEVDSTSSLLSKYIAIVKSHFPSIKHVGVWCTLAGYWDGISDSGRLASSFGPLEKFSMKNPFDHLSPIRIWKLPKMNRLQSFWDEAFRTLKQAGVDFVKVDAQAEFESSSVPWEYREETSKEMEKAANDHFGTDSVLNCMSFGTKGGWFNGARGLGNQDCITFRATDDYFPNVPDAHRWHIANNIYNSLLLSNTPSLLPDFDMFTSFTKGDKLRSEWANFHIAFRSFSGSRLWISDSEPDSLSSQSDKAVKGLLGKQKSGEIGVVQTGGDSVLNLLASRSLPLASSLFDDVLGLGYGKGIKFGSFNPTTGGATLGIWNTRQESDSMEVISVRDVSDLIDSGGNKHNQDFMIFSSSSNTYSTVTSQEIEASKRHSKLSSRPLMSTHLRKAEYSLVRLAPIFYFSTVLVAFVGLLDKYSGLSAVTSDLEKVKRVANPSSVAVKSSISSSTATSSSFSYWFLDTFFKLFESALSCLPGFLLSSPQFINFRRNVREQLLQLLNPNLIVASTAPDESQDFNVVDPSREDDLLIQARVRFAGVAGFILKGCEIEGIKVYLDDQEVSSGSISIEELMDSKSQTIAGAVEKFYLIKVDMIQALEEAKHQTKKVCFMRLGEAGIFKNDDDRDWVLTLALKNE